MPYVPTSPTRGTEWTDRRGAPRPAGDMLRPLSLRSTPPYGVSIHSTPPPSWIGCCSRHAHVPTPAMGVPCSDVRWCGGVTPTPRRYQSQRGRRRTDAIHTSDARSCICGSRRRRYREECRRYRCHCTVCAGAPLPIGVGARGLQTAASTHTNR